MRYLTDDDVQRLGVDWLACREVIAATVDCVRTGTYAQPLKPFLRFGDPRNRIIAMPAWVGGAIDAAGIKWIASFPANIDAGLPRAHAVIVLNDPRTGVPLCIANSALLSIIRTSSVSGFVLERWCAAHPRPPLRVGIIGWGPIGRWHAQMCRALLGDQLRALRVHDLRGIPPTTIPPELRDVVQPCARWQDVYRASDVVITATVASARYIDEPPVAGALLLDVSLRDYHSTIGEAVGAVVVDDWTDVCREDTDIERLHLERGLAADQTLAFPALLDGALARVPADAPILVCPMGMGVFDVAIAAHYLRRAVAAGAGTVLP